MYTSATPMILIEFFCRVHKKIATQLIVFFTSQASLCANAAGFIIRFVAGLAVDQADRG